MGNKPELNKATEDKTMDKPKSTMGLKKAVLITVTAATYLTSYKSFVSTSAFQSSHRSLCTNSLRRSSFTKPTSQTATVSKRSRYVSASMCMLSRRPLTAEITTKRQREKPRCQRKYGKVFMGSNAPAGERTKIKSFNCHINN